VRRVRAGAVSEVIGAIILISISVLAMGIVILAFFSGPLPTSVPSFSGLVTNSSKTVYITHEGGDTLAVGRFKILVDGRDETYNFTKSIRGNFSVGQVMNATLPNWPGRVVMIFNSSWGGETVLLSADLLGRIPFTPPGWYNGAWLSRKRITILGSQVTGNLNDFPVLIYTGADPDLRTKAQNSGNDLLFTSWDGTTKLPHEIENFTGTQSGSLLAWVKVPVLTGGTDTVLYLYYNNSGASNQQDPTNVWTNGYAGVWHLNQTSGTRYDSTANNNDLTDVNTVGRGTGKISDGADFVRTNSEYLTITDAAQTGLDITGPVTMEAWVKNDETANAPYQILEKNRGTTCGSGDPPYFLRLNSAAGNLRECTAVTGICEDPTDAQPGAGTITTGSWVHVVGTNDGSTTRVYKNSVQTDSESYSTGIYNSDGAFYIGSQVNANYFDGIIDEARVSSVARSQDWITTEYTNQNNPGAFITISTEQSPLTMS
jgi:hypothetical protein